MAQDIKKLASQPTVDLQSIEDKEYQELIALCDAFKGEYESENTRRNKLASPENAKKFQAVVDEYFAFAKSEVIEHTIPFLYLDSIGYFTVGCGHLVGFDLSEFWNSSAIQVALTSLEKQIKDEKLTEKNEFKNIDYPEDIQNLLSLSNEERNKMYGCMNVCRAFLDAKDMPFKASKGTKQKKSYTISEETAIVGDSSLAIMKAFNQVLELSVKLRARQKALGRKTNNPFSASSFYIPSGHNSLVLSDGDIEKLAKRDILVKIGELRAHLETTKFDSFPKEAQLALLDLAFNTGSVSSTVKAEALKLDWKKLSQSRKFYGDGRQTDEYEKRNSQVEKWFKEAAKTTSTTPEGVKPITTRRYMREAAYNPIRYRVT